MCLRSVVHSGRPPYGTRVQLTGPDWEFIEPYLSIGEYGPYPERPRQQFEGVIRRFETGGQRRQMPTEFGAWSTVHHRFRQWRDAGVFEALLEGLITEASKRGEVDLSVVSSDEPVSAGTTRSPSRFFRSAVTTGKAPALARTGRPPTRPRPPCGHAGRRTTGRLVMPDRRLE